MNTSTPLDPRTLAHRLTRVGDALHHRLFAQLRDSGIPPKSLLILNAVDGRIDAPWVADRLSRGGGRIDDLAERGWIVRGDEGWSLTDEGRAILDRMDADRSALLDGIPADDLQRLGASLDALATALGADASDDADPRRSGSGARGFGRGFGPGFGPGRRPAFAPGMRGGHGHGHGGHPCEHHGSRSDGKQGEHAEHAHGHHGRFSPEHSAHDDAEPGAGHRGFGHRQSGHGPHRAHRAAQRAFERGFDAGFSRGRESTASE